MLSDVRYAVRFLARQRAFTLVAVVTVALGVGANTAIFSIADAVLFRQLPYADSDRLFVLEPTKLATGQFYGTMAVDDLHAARATGVFDAVMDLDPVGAAFVRDGGRLESVRVQPVPPEYLGVLGVRPLYGRDFNETDRGQRSVLLTYRAWVGSYGANPAVLDATIPTVDGAPMHVVGVLLFEVSPADGLTFAATAVLLSASGLAAAAIPARRATRVDPMIALRAE